MPSIPPRPFHQLAPSFLGLLVLSLSGCMVGPDYKVPANVSAPQFRAAPAVDKRHTSSFPESPSKWWTGLGDPMLDDLIDEALAQNLELAQAIARVDQARAQTLAARSALLPSGDVNASAERAHRSLEDPLGQLANAAPGYDRNDSLFNVNAGASWELDIFGGLRRSSEAAVSEFQATEAASAATRLSVAAQTADTYVLLRTVQARLDVVHDRIESQTKLVDLIRLLQSRGLAADLQLHQAEGVLATVSAAEPVLRSSAESTMNAIEILVGAEPGKYHKQLAESKPIPGAPAITTAGGPASLIRQRPDIIAAERRLQASNARIGVALSDYYPKFSLSALLGTATTLSGNLMNSDSQLASAVFGIRWRLFDFGKVEAEVNAAKGKNREELAAYRLTLLQATADVENAFTELVQRESQAKILVSGEKSLAQARKAAYAAYLSGNVSLIEVIDADDRLQQAEDDRILAQSAATRAAITSFKALGGGWSSSDLPIASLR